MDASGPYVDAVHGEPESPVADTLTAGFVTFVGEEVGADEGVGGATQDGFVGVAWGSREGDGLAPTAGARFGRHVVRCGPSVTALRGPEEPQERSEEVSDRVQHVINSWSFAG